MYSELLHALNAEPFEPFDINMVDGRTFHVKHPELLHVFPGLERTAVLGLPDEQAHEIIDLIHVASLTIAEDEGKGKRKKAG